MASFRTDNDFPLDNVASLIAANFFQNFVAHYCPQSQKLPLTSQKLVHVSIETTQQ